MSGTNLGLYHDMVGKLKMNITASGGVSSLADVRALAADNLYGAILGKALYTGDVELRDALAAARE